MRSATAELKRSLITRLSSAYACLYKGLSKGGMYVYNQHKDLKLVAEVLRQKSIEAATRYAHPTPETKKDAVEAIQGGGY
jgi:hypothetical protein